MWRRRWRRELPLTSSNLSIFIISAWSFRSSVCDGRWWLHQPWNKLRKNKIPNVKTQISTKNQTPNSKFINQLLVKRDLLNLTAAVDADWEFGSWNFNGI